MFRQSLRITTIVLMHKPTKFFHLGATKNGIFSARMKKHTAVKWYCNFPVWGLPHPSVEWEPLKNIASGYRWKGSTVLPFKIGLRDLVVDHMPIRYHSQSNSSGKSNVTVNIFVNYWWRQVTTLVFLASIFHAEEFQVQYCVSEDDWRPNLVCSIWNGSYLSPIWRTALV